jgi:hypothetical protein
MVVPDDLWSFWCRRRASLTNLCRVDHDRRALHVAHAGAAETRATATNESCARLTSSRRTAHCSANCCDRRCLAAVRARGREPGGNLPGRHRAGSVAAHRFRRGVCTPGRDMKPDDMVPRSDPPSLALVVTSVAPPAQAQSACRTASIDPEPLFERRTGATDRRRYTRTDRRRKRA